MNGKIDQTKSIADKIIKEIDDQVKHGLNIKEFNKIFHYVIKKSIEEQLE